MRTLHAIAWVTADHGCAPTEHCRPAEGGMGGLSRWVLLETCLIVGVRWGDAQGNREAQMTIVRDEPNGVLEAVP